GTRGARSPDGPSVSCCTTFDQSRSGRRRYCLGWAILALQINEAVRRFGPRRAGIGGQARQHRLQAGQVALDLRIPGTGQLDEDAGYVLLGEPNAHAAVDLVAQQAGRVRRREVIVAGIGVDLAELTGQPGPPAEHEAAGAVV